MENKFTFTRFTVIGAVLVLAGFYISSQVVHAGVLRAMYSSLKSSIVQPVRALDVRGDNSQTLQALQPAPLPDVESVDASKSAHDAGVSADSLAIKPGQASDGDDSDVTDQTIIYEVKSGDTIATVARMFDVSKDTLRWANSLKSDTLKGGQVLMILPVTGVMHEVKKGDTIASIAKKYKADTDEVYSYNGLKSKSELAIGDMIIIPDGKKDDELKVTESKKKANSKKNSKSKLLDRYNVDLAGYFARPILGGHKTQGLHGHNGIDIGGTVGMPILAAADGTIVIARPSGYNGGYGEMVMIKHTNGTQTLYAHLSGVYVSEGQNVNQGDTIGALGNTGHSTGPHLHFEIRGAVNPF